MIVDQERVRIIYDSEMWRGHFKHSCLDCSVYFLEKEEAVGKAKILAHCNKSGHGMERGGGLSTDQLMEEMSSNKPLSGVIITLGYLCWNTKTASLEGTHALIAEAHRLVKLGASPSVIVVDNGSTDDTRLAIINSLDEWDFVDFPLWITRNPTNQGISMGRNQIIRYAQQSYSNFLMLMDGDIEIVPLSAYTMARYLLCHEQVGCIGAYSSNYSTHREDCASRLIEIPESRVRKDIDCAWTQYGMFRCLMFDQGIKFDEDGPFGQPGWGFEDDDLCFQMIERGWLNRYFGGMKYLHRNIRSSFPNLQQTGVDIEAMFNKRKHYLIDKWMKRGFDSAKINRIRGQHLPR